MRNLAPEAEFDYFKSLQEAFYAENVDITDLDNCARLVTAFKIDGQAFLTEARSEKNYRETWNDFAAAQEMGIRGFPSIVLRRGEQLGLLTAGYQPFERLQPIIHKFFAEEAPYEND